MNNKKKPEAIVYTSNTGYTAEYAEMLSKKIGIPAIPLTKSKVLKKETPVIYMGWIMANHIKGYKSAERYYDVAAVCAVGLCETGALIDEIRKAEKLSPDLPLFTLQGGMDHGKLRGINKFMINMLLKMLAKNEKATEDDRRKFELIKNGGNFVNEANLAEFMKWYGENY